MSESINKTQDDIASVGERIRAEVSKVIVGAEDTINLVLTALLTGGHVLLEDVPGTGKTLMARAFAKAIGGDFKRIQFTPDLMPSDVIGINFFSQTNGSFEFRPGPIIGNIILADEINRATPRTQSALLEAMAEGTITVDGDTINLPIPFVVLATQNPVEQEGTFPLPEAQLDRFLIRLKIGYPDQDGEVEILKRFEEKSPLDTIDTASTPKEIVSLQKNLSGIYVNESIRSYIANITRATREHSAFDLGASPRATLALFQATRASAAINGRNYVNPEDVKKLVKPVLSHRLLLSTNSRLRGRGPEEVLDEVLQTIPVPVADE